MYRSINKKKKDTSAILDGVESEMNIKLQQGNQSDVKINALSFAI
jgi:hypothetical protein